jgi:hypothetical protein
MPKLLLLAIAEKVISDQAGRPSLITLFDGLEVHLPHGEEIPSNAVIPKEWSAFAQWLWAEEERGKEFFQGVTVTYPDGKLFFKQVLKLDSSKARANVGISFLGFPVGQAGPVRVDVWLEQNEIPVTEIFSVAVTVTVKPLEPGEVTPQQITMPTNPAIRH